MSSFVVSRETVNRVCHLLDLDCDNRPTGGRYVTLESAGHLGDQLWALNAAATGYRYGDGPYALSAFVFRYSPWYTVYELIKAARCWLYQCCEGGQFTSHELYQRVLKRVQQAEQRVVSLTTEYEAAAWDSEECRSKGGVA